MAAPTACVVGKRLLRYLGVVSLDASTPAGQNFPIEPNDLDDVIGVMNGGLQEMFDLGPSFMREQNNGGLLNAPTQVTLTATLGSQAISALTTYSAWQLGCTIRIAGDDQDNELSSSTQLVRPYMGTSGSAIQATVYADSVQLDATVDRVMNPLTIPNRMPLLAATDRIAFMRFAGYPLVSNTDGTAYGGPFGWFVKKSVGTPIVWFVESFYNSALTYLAKRIRFAPMPDTTYAFSYRAALNPPLLATTDIDNGDHATDPGTVIALPNAWVDSIYIPLCIKRLTALPKFHNKEAIPEVERGYKTAIGTLKNASRGQSAQTQGIYI
jgi:hypothetical protein